MVNDRESLLDAERRLAAAEGCPYAVPCDCHVEWDAGAPLPILLQSDDTATLFSLLPDEDRRVGQLSFDGLLSSSFGSPNDETFQGHPLYGSGFQAYQAMRVVGSPWIARLERMNSVHPYHHSSFFAAVQHFIFPFHDSTFECVAQGFTASTVEQRLLDVVKDAVDRLY